ncbi:uncharacterized protein LOC114930918 [Nylanderia fulva]|uniref:uncharacterized protein LOC114930918 n=1 Tax=Nylanderia fulva TaxID=613905 RepID=UPI0010FAEFB4|nr:uncharacterized protein LOC114930918 [Nylanderia fulva]
MATSPPQLEKAGRGFVVASWGSTIIISVYLSPNLGYKEYVKRLHILERQTQRHHPRPVIVAGDFNAKHKAWGSPRTDRRGERVMRWAADSGLILINEGREQTCVRMRGGSIIDLTWTTRPATRMTRGWKVMTEVETLSDHKYITFNVTAIPREVVERRKLQESRTKRWTLRKINEEDFMTTINNELMARENKDRSLAEQVEWLQETMTKASDASMPRVKHRSSRKAYWWSEAIAELRKASDHARRQALRMRKPALIRTPEYKEKWSVYREARDTLRIAIRRAKSEAWQELLATLNDDPWGRPYRMVLNKLKGGASPLTETLDPRLVGEIIDTLFPVRELDEEPIPRVEREWDEDETRVTAGELKMPSGK